jgi:UDP-N-acetylmuramoyl-L-alanyl-D-glutamate--2,6-diaminopimelate ligase
MRERGVSAAAMEVSSHALALHRVDGIRYAVAAFTNLSQDHLDFHHDLEDYFAAKARLFTPALADRGVVNVSDPYGARLADAAGVPVVTVATDGPSATAEWRVADVDLGARGSRFRLRGPDVDVAVAVALPGAFNVANAALAVVSLVTAGVPVDAAATGVGSVTGVPGRMERIDRGQPFTAIVDYAHTPEAVATLLSTLRAVTPGRLIVVVGCGGDRDRAKRPGMGAAAAAGADVVLLTNDNPRSEDPMDILAAAAAGAESVPADRRAEVTVEPDRGRAIEQAVAQAAPGDTVVVAGKGHETGQDVGGVVTPFDDRIVLADAIAAVSAR